MMQRKLFIWYLPHSRYFYVLVIIAHIIMNYHFHGNNNNNYNKDCMYKVVVESTQLTQLS